MSTNPKSVDPKSVDPKSASPGSEEKAPRSRPYFCLVSRKVPHLMEILDEAEGGLPLSVYHIRLNTKKKVIPTSHPTGILFRVAWLILNGIFPSDTRPHDDLFEPLQKTTGEELAEVLAFLKEIEATDEVIETFSSWYRTYVLALGNDVVLKALLKEYPYVSFAGKFNCTYTCYDQNDEGEITMVASHCPLGISKDSYKGIDGFLETVRKTIRDPSRQVTFNKISSFDETLLD